MKFVVLILVEIMIAVIGILITTVMTGRLESFHQSNSTAGLRSYHGSIHDSTDV